MAKSIDTEKVVNGIIKEHPGSAIVMVEVPADTYFESSVSTIKTLIENGYLGIYVSFQRPFKNLDALLKEKKIDTKKMYFIDVATAMGGEPGEQNERCIHVSPSLEIDEIVRAIYTSIPNLKSKKVFIFIDSMTTIALYKPLSETMRFSEFLVRTVKHELGRDTLLVFNVAKDLSQKKFIKEIALKVDEVVEVA
jgi:KaiC/GvpD/RAD55 family RecA-like ATPase